MLAVDLNADLGEGGAADAALLEVITSVNVPCGGHAGDATSMRATVRLAAARGVAVGAHPSYPDREGFGRRAIPMDPEALTEVLAEQIQALREIAAQQGVRLQHVKPHGALYNVAVEEPAVAEAIGRAIGLVDPSLIAVALAGTGMAKAFARLGLRVCEEGFIDREYTAQGVLVPRSHPEALLTDPAQAAARAVAMVREGRVRSIEGTDIRMQVRTLCVHADTPGSPDLAAAARRALERAGVQVLPMRDLPAMRAAR